MIRYLLFSVLLCFSCASQKPATSWKTNPDEECILRLLPSPIRSSLYSANVDVAGKHLSGLLFIKQMEDSSSRVVFTSQAGITFFDLEFRGTEEFAVRQVIPQLNKKPVLNMLREDFSLVLGLPFRNQRFVYMPFGNEVLYAPEKGDRKAFFITGPDCRSLLRLATGTVKKQKVSVIFEGNPAGPEGIVIQHHNFSLLIRLNKIIRDNAAE